MSRDEEQRRGVLTAIDHRHRVRHLTLRIDPTSHIPPYEQLRAQFSVMIAVGQLEPRARLPTVRDIAEALDLAPGTVARAIRELARDGLVIGEGRRGTFVVDEPPGSEPLIERKKRLDAAAATFAAAVRQLGIRSDTALAAVQQALHDFERERSE